MTSSAVGYSGTPLAKKLGYKEATRALVIDAPRDYKKLLEPLPNRVVFRRLPDANVDLVHLFVTEREVLVKQLDRLRCALKADAVLWVSWPKKSSGVVTSVSEDVIRQVALPLGWVDIKVCAVSPVWSGLKLVVRKQLRA